MEIKKCNKCKQELPNTTEYFYRRNGYKLHGICKGCSNKMIKKWRNNHPDKIKGYNRKYWQSDKGKEIRSKWDIKTYTENKESELERNKNYLKTEAGKESTRRRHARRKDLGYIELYSNPFDESEEVEWHHIDNEHVVAIPKDLHQLYNGNSKYHKCGCMKIIKQVYLEND